MKKLSALFLTAAFLCSGFSIAEEGMWLYNAVPKDKLKSIYGFEPTQAWLTQMQLSSVKFPGGSGSFVSPNGLVMTNHHIAAGCIHAVSTAEKDFMKTGFYAGGLAGELKCQGMTVQILMGIEDITAKLNAALKDVPKADLAASQRTAITRLQTECNTASKLNCQAVPMYAGAMYFMYKYKGYNDVRLVFAPEYEMAFFGGDPDNFEYPRYDLDVTFLRVYEDNKPLHPEHYFPWSKKGAKNNELVFVSGHPGTTERGFTVAQMEFLRDFQYPYTIANGTRTVGDLIRRSAASEEVRRNLERTLFSAQNSLKANKGYYSGLIDKELMAAKAADEKQLRDAFEKDAKLKEQYGDPWKDIADYYRALREGNLWADRQLFPAAGGGRGGGGGGRGGGGAAQDSPGAFRGTLADLARTLVRAADEKEKPEAERTAAYRDTGAVEQRLFATDQKINKDEDIAALAATLAAMNRLLPGNAFVTKTLGGKTPEQVARDIINGTRIADVEFRRQVYAGGKTALNESTDALVALILGAEAEVARVNDEYAGKVTPLDAARAAALTNIAKIRFAIQGLNYPPDANSTLRLSYGSVKGYVEDGLGTAPKGTKLAPFTTMKQAFEYAEAHGGKDPYKLPDSWIRAQDKVSGKTPLNFVSTNDIIGGNSGSPVLNKKAEVVGLIFDGNIQMLPGRFQFGDKMNRSVSVDSRAIMEALRHIYNAEALAKELAGK